jgi:hypothetical protein
MVEMAMGDEQLFDRHTLFRGGREQPVEVAPGVGECSAHRFGTP